MYRRNAKKSPLLGIFVGEKTWFDCRGGREDDVIYEEDVVINVIWFRRQCGCEDDAIVNMMWLL